MTWWYVDWSLILAGLMGEQFKLYARTLFDYPLSEIDLFRSYGCTICLFCTWVEFPDLNAVYPLVATTSRKRSLTSPPRPVFQKTKSSKVKSLNLIKTSCKRPLLVSKNLGWTFCVVAYILKGLLHAKLCKFTDLSLKLYYNVLLPFCRTLWIWKEKCFSLTLHLRWRRYLTNFLVQECVFHLTYCIKDLSFLYFLTLNLWIHKQASFVFGFHLPIYVGDQIFVFDENQCNFKMWRTGHLLAQLCDCFFTLMKQSLYNAPLFCSLLWMWRG